MTGFPINPPRTPLVDQRGYVTPEWYRYFAQIQNELGQAGIMVWEEGFMLATQPPQPASIMDIEGGEAAPLEGVLTVREDYTVTSYDCMIRVDASDAPVTIIIPEPQRGRRLYVKKVDSTINTVAVYSADGSLIDGAVSKSTGTQYVCWMFLGHDTGWDIV